MTLTSLVVTPILGSLSDMLPLNLAMTLPGQAINDLRFKLRKKSDGKTEGLQAFLSFWVESIC